MIMVCGALLLSYTHFLSVEEAEFFCFDVVLGSYHFIYQGNKPDTLRQFKKKNN
jgi:hypothetical protein